MPGPGSAVPRCTTGVGLDEVGHVDVEEWTSSGYPATVRRAVLTTPGLQQHAAAAATAAVGVAQPGHHQQRSTD